MKKFFIISLLLFSCSVTKNISLSHERLNEYELFNNAVKDKTCSIKFISGQSVTANNIGLIRDSLKYISVETNSSKSININVVQNISFKNHFTGIIQGIVFGVFTGGTAGYLMGTGSAWQGYSVVVSGLGGIITGVIIGSVKGNRFIYKFNSLNNEDIKPPIPVYPDTIFIENGNNFPIFITEINNQMVKGFSGFELTITSSSMARIKKIILENVGRYIIQMKVLLKIFLSYKPL